MNADIAAEHTAEHTEDMVTDFKTQSLTHRGYKQMHSKSPHII